MRVQSQTNWAASSAEQTDLTAQLARLPRPGSQATPWTSRGWLLPQVVLLHGLVPAVADRWGYHLRTLEAGRLLDEPIPQVVFAAADERVFDLLRQWSSLVGWDRGGWGDFRVLLDWLSWGLALGDSPPPLGEVASERLYRRVNLAPLLERPHDYLGSYLARGTLKGWNPSGLRATPHLVVECMVRMTFQDARDDVPEPRILRVFDPSAGSGRVLLHASNYSLNLHGEDSDPLAITLSKINGVLYAPWLAFPLPASVLGLHDEALTPAAGCASRGDQR